MRIVTRNVWLYTRMKYAPFLKLTTWWNPITDHHFQVYNTQLVNEILTEIQPDIVVFQEIEDQEHLKTLFRTGKDNKHQQQSWEPQHSYTTAFLNSHPKYPKKSVITPHILQEQVHTTAIWENLHVLMYEGMGIIPIHLDAFSAGKRLLQIHEVCKFIDSVQYPVILLGDFNLRHYKDTFLYQWDRQAYELLTNRLYDATQQLASTTPRGASFDKIFLSHELAWWAVTVGTVWTAKPQAQIIKKAWAYMDHYPVFVDL